MEPDAHLRPDDVVTVTVSVGDPAEGRRIAGSVVDAGLAACAKVTGPVTSTYRWEGRVTTDEEWLVTMVSTGAALDRLVRAVRAEHSYDVPEVLAAPAVGGDADYLAWVREETVS